jgi:hypothetical protein
MDAQEEHDYMMAKRLERLAKNGRTIGESSRERLETALKKKSRSTTGSESGDPIASAMANNPGLNREEVAEMAEKFGF